MIHFGGISKEEFLKEYWQKKPILIKNAIPNFISPLSPNELAGYRVKRNLSLGLLRAPF